MANSKLDIIAILDEAEEMYKAKMARKEYAEYRNNSKAAKILFDDCLRMALWEKLTLRKAIEKMGGV